jgi:nitrogen fixation NifU-like protein
MIYSAKVLEYFLDPKHAYRMEQPDGIGVVGDLSCGDFFVMYVRVRDERLTEVSYQIFGCPAAIATCEAAAEMATGSTLDEAQRITDESVSEFLGGLPEMKLHCSNSAADALHCAIADYRTETREEDEKATEVIEDATR